MIKRSHVRQFLAVVDTGSFTRAAARIHVAQPTLSAGIADLERLVGARVFVRERKQIRLTEVGGRFMPIARRLEQDFRALDSLAGLVDAGPQTLKFGVLRTIPRASFQRLMGGLSSSFQLEVVDGSNSELRSRLAHGKLHCAVTVIGVEDDASAIPVLAEPYRMMVSSSHALANRHHVMPADLAHEVMIARRSCEVLHETSRFFTSVGVRPRFAYRSEDDDRCMAMVAEGRGITTAPLSMKVPGTVAIEVEGYDLQRRVGLVGEWRWLQDPANTISFNSIASTLRQAFA